MNAEKILIVEDEFVVAETIRNEIESMGYTVMGLVSSGEEAIEEVQKTRPDMVLMDIRLSGSLDGLDTALRLRTEWNIPSFFLTAYADQGLLDRAKIVEPLGYIVKPYDRKSLRAGIEMALYKARLERLLKESESRFRSMFENFPVAYLVLDRRLRCLDFNPEFCLLLGRSAEEIAGVGLEDFCPPEQTDLLRDRFSGAGNQGKMEMELQLLGKDRMLLTTLILGRLQNDIDGNPSRWHCIFADITRRRQLEEERNKAEQALRESEQHLRAAAKAANFGVYSYDFTNRKAFCSAEFLHLLGFDEQQPPEFDDDFIRTVIYPDDLDSFYRQARKASDPSGLGMLDGEFRIVLPDGRRRWMRVIGQTLFADERPVNASGAIHDITDRKRAERILRRVNENLEKRVQERTAELEQSNKTLFAMLNFAQKAENEIKDCVTSNLRTNILFLLESLKKEKLSKNAHSLVEMIESTTKNLSHPLARNLESSLLKLSSREIEVANLLRHGKTTKEICELLNIGLKTAETHRNNLRKKLGLSGKKKNLRIFLNSEFLNEGK